MKKIPVFVLLLLSLVSTGAPRFRAGTVTAVTHAETGASVPGFRCIILAVELDCGRGLWIGDYTLLVHPSEQELPCLGLMLPGENKLLQKIPADSYRKRKVHMLFQIPETARTGKLKFKLFGTGCDMPDFPLETENKKSVQP